jgi:hypothetical protein
MSERGMQLLETASGQISELIELISTRDEAALRLECPGREKLGDGTVAACVSHTAGTYNRIAGFLRGVGPHEGDHGHDSRHRVEDVNVGALLDQLSAASDAIDMLATLTDEELDTVPPNSGMRFCDGQRTLEQVLASMLRHQAHQIDAVRAALA